MALKINSVTITQKVSGVKGGVTGLKTQLLYRNGRRRKIHQLSPTLIDIGTSI